MKFPRTLTACWETGQTRNESIREAASLSTSLLYEKFSICFCIFHALLPPKKKCDGRNVISCVKTVDRQNNSNSLKEYIYYILVRVYEPICKFCYSQSPKEHTLVNMEADQRVHLLSMVNWPWPINLPALYVHIKLLIITLVSDIIISIHLSF